MIVQEIIEGNTPLVKTYSDKGVMIRKKGTDEIYSEAIDPEKVNQAVIRFLFLYFLQETGRLCMHPEDDVLNAHGYGL